MTKPSPATWRYFFRLGLSLAFYVILLFPVDWAVRGHQLTGTMLYVAAVLPALPVLGVIWAMLRFLVEEEDEYKRFVRVRAFLGATGLTLAVTTVWGFLENFAAIVPLPAMDVFFIFMASLGIAQPIAQWWNR